MLPEPAVAFETFENVNVAVEPSPVNTSLLMVSAVPSIAKAFQVDKSVDPSYLPVSELYLITPAYIPGLCAVVPDGINIPEFIWLVSVKLPPVESSDAPANKSPACTLAA